MLRTKAAGIEDTDGIMQIQWRVYPEQLVESRDVIASIVRCGLSCVSTLPNGIVVGALLAHPTLQNQVHLLHEEQEQDKPSRDQSDLKYMFIHDTIIHPEFQRRGIGSALVSHLIGKHPKVTLQLVAVRGADAFWERFGFVRVPDVHLSDSVVANYGGGNSSSDDVIFMSRDAEFAFECDMQLSRLQDIQGG